jgi:hypothetical protein
MSSIAAKAFRRELLFERHCCFGLSDDACRCTSAQTEITIAGQVVNILRIGKNVGFLTAQLDLESVCQ